MKVWALLLFTLIHSSLRAQQVSIRGQVLGPMQKGINAANILLQDSSLQVVKGTISSADGSFQFEKLMPGSYAMITTAVGYSSSTLNVVLPKDTVIVITLTPMEKSLSASRARASFVENCTT